MKTIEDQASRVNEEAEQLGLVLAWLQSAEVDGMLTNSDRLSALGVAETAIGEMRRCTALLQTIADRTPLAEGGES